MPFHPLSTSKIAHTVGCHPNTVMLYEKWGLIASVPRAANGYRLYTEEHLDQMRLARTALDGLYPGKVIRRKAYRVIALTVTGELELALEQAGIYLESIKKEQKRASKALQVIDTWVDGLAAKNLRTTWSIGEVAKNLDLTVDQLRNWERNGLINARRDPQSGYRLYGAAEISRLRVIRMLRLAGYSTMAILRMMIQLEQGMKKNLRHALDTPRPDEDVYTAAHRWLSTLAEQEKSAKRIVVLIQTLHRGTRVV